MRRRYKPIELLELQRQLPSAKEKCLYFQIMTFHSRKRL